MARYKLHCFGQSGNSYKVALYLNCAGLDWEPAFVDFFKGATRDAKWRESVNDMGEAPVLETAEGKLSQSGAILTHLSETTGKFAPASAAERLEALRWMLFDNHKFTSYLATYRFLRAFAQPAPDANVVAFLKGRFDAAAAIVDKHLAQSEFVVGRQADDGRLLARRLRLLSRRGARLRLGQDPPQHPRLDRAPARAPRLEGALRADAGRAHQARAGERAFGSSAAACSRRARRHRRRHRHRALHLHADPAAHGRGAAPDQGRGRPDRLGELPGLPRRRPGCRLAAPARGAACLAAGCARHQRGHHRRHGVARWHARLPGAALHRRSGQRLCAGARIGARSGTAERGRPRQPFRGALFGRRHGHHGVGPADLGARVCGHGLASHMARGWALVARGLARGRRVRFRRRRLPRRNRRPPSRLRRTFVSRC